MCITTGKEVKIVSLQGVISRSSDPILKILLQIERHIISECHRLHINLKNYYRHITSYYDQQCSQICDINVLSQSELTRQQIYLKNDQNILFNDFLRVPIILITVLAGHLQQVYVELAIPRNKVLQPQSIAMERNQFKIKVTQVTLYIFSYLKYKISSAIPEIRGNKLRKGNKNLF